LYYAIATAGVFLGVVSPRVSGAPSTSVFVFSLLCFYFFPHGVEFVVADAVLAITEHSA
jgi:hypothetical protein